MGDAVSAFTPGPYLVRIVDVMNTKSVSVQAASGAVIALLKHVHGNKEANANLLAAAPDMYEALKEAVPLIERAATEEARSNLAPTGLAKRGEKKKLLAAAKAALAKAEGRTP